MLYFVEYLRARNAVRVALILLGIFLVIAIVLRIALHAPSAQDWAIGLQSSPTAHVSKTRLPNGATRIVVDDPRKHTHAVIVQRGSTTHMVITEPQGTQRSRSRDGVSMGSMSVNESSSRGVSRTTVDYTRGFTYDLGLLFAITIPIGLIVATMLGGALAKENDGHLELAWTKPVSRERYALAAVGVDVAAILLSQLLTMAFALGATLLFVVPSIGYARAGWEIPLALLAPIAWYALLTAFSASLKRGPGLVVGLGWVFAIIVPNVAVGLAHVAGVNRIAAWFYAIFHGLAFLDPLAYLSYGSSNASAPVLQLSAQAAVGALAALSIGYIALSVLQWRRLEA